MPAVTIDADEAEASVSADAGLTAIDIVSPKGIGSARIELPPDVSPRNVVIRLYLKGLEELRLSYGQVTITASVASGEDHRVRQSLARQDDPSGEQPLMSSDPFWLDIQIVSHDNTPRIPLETGYFEVRLPEDASRAGATSFWLRWIDFYR